MASAIQDLIAKKNYGEAIKAITAELKKKPREVRLRMQHADVLIMAGKTREAIPVLLSLADEHASDGFTAKAIAFLKRIEKIEPGRQDVEDRLSRLVQEKVSSAPAPSRSSAPAFGLEEFDPGAELSLGGESTSVPAAEPEPLLAEPSVSDSIELEGMDSIEIEPEPEPVNSASQ